MAKVLQKGLSHNLLLSAPSTRDERLEVYAADPFPHKRVHVCLVSVCALVLVSPAVLRHPDIQDGSNHA